MDRRRWRRLDRDKPERGASEHEAPPAPPPAGAPPAAAPPHPSPAQPPVPELAPARALYSLGALERCVELLQPLAARESPPPGARRLLGLSLGRLGQLNEAIGVLSRAVEAHPGDALLHASLLSAEIMAGRHPEPPADPAEGPLTELAGAAAWLRGQTSLHAARPASAAAYFQRAGKLLGPSAAGSVTAERATAAFIGEAVSRLAAGQLEAAQQCYLRLPGRERLPSEAARFARQLYEVADALNEIDPADRPEALQPLVELVNAARLRLRFFDQERPVEIWWDRLP